MSGSSLKIVIPMAGYGTRLRPHTWSRPKQLIRLADKMVIDHVLDTFADLPNTFQTEYIFIVGYLGHKIEQYMRSTHSDLKVRYVEQTEMRGQSHAISLAKDYLDGPMLMIYGDTLIKCDFSFLATETAEAVAWVKAVPDPRRFGVASLGEDGWVTHLVEKPQDVNNNLVLAGCYYFKNSSEVITALDEQMKRNVTLKDEFYFADAVNIMLERGLKMRVEHVDTWLDAGTSDDVLSTNRYLLEHGHDNTAEASAHLKSVIRRPVFIHPTANVENSVIGPHAAIGANCTIQSCIIRDSIIEDASVLTNVIMERSLIGREVHIEHQAGVMNVGDQTELTL
ncbi:MAG: sugar phosphate nucleotidyltransferase [Anaerolineales bacterium]